jgi:hypothetical protein
MADGTAPQCGRVGSCHIYYINPSTEMFEGFLILNQDEKSKKEKVKRQNRDLRYNPATSADDGRTFSRKSPIWSSH